MELAQQQQQFSSAAWRKAVAWLRLPGCSVVLEMVLRNISPLSDASHASNMIHLAQIALGQWLMLNTSLLPCKLNISSVASMHKVLLLYTYTADDTLPPLDSTPHLSMVLELLYEAHRFLNAIVRVGLTPAHVHEASRLVKLPNLSASSQTHATHLEVHNRSGHSSSTLISGSNGGVNINYNNSPEPVWSPAIVKSFTEELHQLHACMVMVLVWTGNVWERLIEGQVPSAQRLMIMEDRSTWLAKLGFKYPQLATVARQLFLANDPTTWGTPASTFRREAAAWDAYALQHFHGRLLPGCSYLRCTNLAGASEASLRTLLCNGCKRMRYCSVKCQKAAWVEGRHHVVCGKGIWADKSLDRT